MRNYFATLSTSDIPAFSDGQCIKSVWDGGKIRQSMAHTKLLAISDSRRKWWGNFVLCPHRKEFISRVTFSVKFILTNGNKHTVTNIEDAWIIWLKILQFLLFSFYLLIPETLFCRHCSSGPGPSPPGSCLSSVSATPALHCASWDSWLVQHTQGNRQGWSVQDINLVTISHFRIHNNSFLQHFLKTSYLKVSWPSKSGILYLENRYKKD